jgi:hypothetical protein
LNGKYIINKNGLYTRQTKIGNKRLQNKDALYMRNINKIPKQTLPNRGSL